MDPLKMFFLFNMGIFHCYVQLVVNCWFGLVVWDSKGALKLTIPFVGVSQESRPPGLKTNNEPLVERIQTVDVQKLLPTSWYFATIPLSPLFTGLLYISGGFYPWDFWTHQNGYLSFTNQPTNPSNCEACGGDHRCNPQNWGKMNPFWRAHSFSTWVGSTTNSSSIISL